ncbi:hypothetical protein H310_02884 [Aphanomyces invadans]|uniref:Tubulin-tyrosine ligase n=1 Tax=Aphanomyces invadans TaxID=157072 RepID=A0A024UK71_9STRA|nr:hypothetical protein H310_02884 [Aphanomyces invadans]ETW06704.1 hypothetical protein H310_02884 [Aphanomyces invadans]|eukprot:XP_008864779.1 hypothetical protein H310_02884 [Aphanomyces invadans]
MLKNELGRKWRDIPWADVLEKSAHADKYFMRSGLIRKDLLPLYAAEYMPKTFVVKSMDSINEIIPLMEEEDKHASNDVWVLKLSDSSNAYGIHFFHRKDASSLAYIVQDGQTRVVQKNVQSALFNGRKFHVRVLVLAVGHLDVYVYDRSRVLVASAPYSPTASLTDALVHITNMGVNQARNDLYDSAVQNMALSDVFSPDLVATAMDQVHAICRDTFRRVSTNRRHFFSLPNCYELFGLDFMIDDGGRVLLLEVNPDPSLGMFYRQGEVETPILPRDVLVDGAPPSFVQVYSRSQDEAFALLKARWSAECRGEEAQA